MTSLQLRSANPAKSRADVVVIGVRETAGGPELAPGAEDVGKAYGRKLRPLLSSLGITGKAGETARIPTGKTISAPGGGGMVAKGAGVKPAPPPEGVQVVKEGSHFFCDSSRAFVVTSGVSRSA